MDNRLFDAGRLVLRVGVAGLLLMHGIAKIRNGIGFVQDQVEQVGFPEFVAYGVYAGEILAPILVIAGVMARPAALVMAFSMAFAILLARRHDITTVGRGGGLAIELELLFLIGAVSIALLGAGRYAVQRGSRWT
ncbi:MAG TPA: DoxX family protein [Gemmatimonadaceae bacterium]